ncbi:unnamed protein product [Effrenium voratum]|uniref:Uncharacterized protein n=1 Tax=Effrenium voratum TaxID=2562239 RepID=A0AA36MYV6_9DINO|nr:unnamed protein product [Effrenium voratum]
MAVLMRGRDMRGRFPSSWESYQEDYEQQLALRAHLDSLAVELSVQTTALDLLRTEVALLLSRRRVRHHRDLAFRAWRLCSAPAASALPAASAPVTWEPVTRGHRSDRGRDDYTLRSATLICFFQSRDRLQHALSHWRLAVQRRGPGRALPLWRMQLCFGAWRGLLGHGCGHERLLATRRKAANALRTLRDYDLLYFVLQAWNGAVVSAALAHLDGSRREGVFQPKISGVPRDSFPRRVESPVRSGQRSPERSRRPSHLHRAFRAWRGQSAQSASEQRRLSLIAAQVRREKLLLTMHCWHKAASLERSSRTCGQVWQQAAATLARTKARNLLWAYWRRWSCGSWAVRQKSQSQRAVRRLGAAAAQALRMCRAQLQALLVLRHWHFLVLLRCGDRQRRAAAQSREAAEAKSRVLERLLRLTAAEALRRLAKAALAWWRRRIHSLRLQNGRLGRSRRQVLAEALGLWRRTSAEMRRSQGAAARKGKLQERALTLWLGRGCRDLLRTAWQRWRWHRRGRRVVDRITELTYSGVLAEDAVLLRGCWACWHAMVLKRLRCNHCLKLLRLEQGRATIQLAFQCWRCFVTASEQEAALGEMKCRDRLRSTSAQAVAALQALWRCSIFLQCLRAWSLLILQQRHSRQSVAEQADAEDAFRRQADLQKERALTLWLGRGCRDLLRTAWQRWRWHRRGRRVVDRITELTYSGVLAEDAVLLRGCWACWHAMVLKRLRCNHCLKLLRLEQGRAMIQLAFQCWRCFVTAAEQELRGMCARDRSELLLGAAAARRSLQELRCAVMVWRQHARFRRWLGWTSRASRLKPPTFKAFWAWYRGSQTLRLERRSLQRCLRAWQSLALQTRRRLWAEHARQDRYLLRHSLSGWRTQVLVAYRLLLHQWRESARFAQHAQRSAWKMLGDQLQLEDLVLQSYCFRAWAWHWSGERHLATSRALLALERLYAQLRSQEAERLARSALRLWQSAVKDDTERFLSVCLRRVGSLQTALARLRAFHAWRSVNPAKRIYAYTLLARCLQHRALAELAFRAWRQLRTPKRPEAEEMLLLCQGLETQNADLVLLLQERASANALLETELQDLEPLSEVEMQNADLVQLLQESASANALLETELQNLERVS